MINCKVLTNFEQLAAGKRLPTMTSLPQASSPQLRMQFAKMRTEYHYATKACKNYSIRFNFG